MTEATQAAITDVLNTWEDNDDRCKDCFLRLKTHCENLDGIALDWQARPGISYSLRAKHQCQSTRNLFAMVDIIDDDPAQRWLSVCFYGDMISDPDGLGDFVPGGLLGEDAVCFDLDTWDEAQLTYVESRLHEACTAAAAEA